MKKNLLSYILLLLLILIICYLWNEVVVNLLRQIDIILIVFNIPIFSSSNLLSILILFFICIYIFHKRGKIVHHIKKFFKSLITFGSLQEHYIVFSIISVIISSLIIHPNLFQSAFFFNGDYIVIIIIASIIFLPINQKQIARCPSIERNIFDESPIESFEEDRLDFIDLVENISTNLISRENGQNAASIELRGKWGSGKTSLINLLDLFLEDQKKQNKVPAYLRIRSIKIVVSKFEKPSLLYLHFFYEVVKKLEEEYLLPRIDTNMILASIFERIGKGINLSALQNRTMQLPKIEVYLNKISEWLCLTNLTIVCYLDDIDRLSDKQIQGVFKLIRLVKYNMKNLVLISAADFEKYQRYYNHFIKKS